MQPRAHCVISNSLKVIPPTSCSLIYLYNVAIYLHSDFSYISDIYKTCPMNIGNFNVWLNLPYLSLYTLAVYSFSFDRVKAVNVH